MPGEFKKKVVMSLGGSIIFPGDDIDTAFLGSFIDVIKRHVEKGTQFFIVVGGGKICRKYQQALKDLGNADQRDGDMIGIATINTNAHLLSFTFKPLSFPGVVYRPDQITDEVRKHPVIIGGADEPGHSSDYDAVLIARSLGANEIINLSNTTFVYDKDPAKFEDATPLHRISWAEYLKLVPEDFTPGLSTPFDPVASRGAAEGGVSVYIADGKNLDNLEKILNENDFEGTVIHP